MKSKLKKIVLKILKILYKLTYRLIKTDDNTVVFIAFHGRGYLDNPRYLYEAMKKDPNFKDKKMIWMIKRKYQNKVKIPGAKIISYNSPSYFYYMAKAKYWIINCKMPGYLLKKANQVYLQTWHGTPLKRLAHDIIECENQTFYRSEMNREDMLKSYDVDVAKYTYMIAPNDFCYKIFQHAFKIDEKRLIKTGYPRNDYLINNANDVNYLNALKEKYQLPLDKKIILYAPTWRDNKYTDQGYEFSIELDLKLWKEMLKDDYFILFKPHYLITKHNLETNDFLRVCDATMDINDLYLISDLLITDYSSVFFDYANLKRPIYFYMFDIESYAKELRGFYLDIYKDLPGDIYTEEQTLLNAIKTDNYDYERLNKFNNYFNTYEDGKASERILNILGKE